MPKKLLILLHEDDTTAGTTHQWCADRNIANEILVVPQIEEFPSTEEFSAILICGGDMDVNQVEKFPWLKTEKKFIRESLLNDKSILGLCLGSQLLAEQLGAKVTQSWTWEIGWYNIENLISSLPRSPFHWHKSTFELPPNAVRIAKKDTAKIRHLNLRMKTKFIRRAFSSIQRWINFDC